MKTGNQKSRGDLESSERMLKKENVQLQEFLENAPVPLHWINGSGIIIWINNAELAMLGYDREELINQHISKVHADKDVLEDILLRLMNRETILNYPVRLICKSGAIKHVLISSSVYREGDKFIHTRCITNDITRLKAMETERESLLKSLQDQVQELQHALELKQEKLA